METLKAMTTLVSTNNWKDARFDGVVAVAEKPEHLQGMVPELASSIAAFIELDSGAKKSPTFIVCDDHPKKRLIYSGTGPADGDYEDVRCFRDAAGAGIKRAVEAGCRAPLLICAPHTRFPNAQMVAGLGALHALYTPLEIREAKPATQAKVDQLGLYGFDKAAVDKLTAMESGRIVCRDIGGSDPERTAPPKIAKYVSDLFKDDASVTVTVTSDVQTFRDKYPLLEAVNRATENVDRHTARLIHLSYEGQGPITKTYLLVGKGVTYDTGGADVKVGGAMAGMHRDKCGAAAVAGFFQILSQMKPAGVKVLGAMACVRNSIGSNCYVADEIITSRAGVRVRINNTDAEGRMAMADVLCEMKEKALNETNPSLFTIATLTGHAVIAYGPNYSAVIDNGPARSGTEGMSRRLQAAGSLIGEPCEISTLRKEDFKPHMGATEYEDVMQSCGGPSTREPRGHVTPAAFLQMASGLDKHGCNSENPLPYTHIDIAGSSGPFPGVPTGTPLLGMTEALLL